MNRPGIRPLTPRELRHPLRTAFAALPQDAERALLWMRRGPLATSIMLPLAVRRVLLRLGGVHLGSHIWGLDRCYFESEHVSLGNGVGVNTGCFFEGHGRILVGRDTFIGPQVMIVTSVHEFGPGGEVARQPAYRDVRIGDRCWIGARATILPGVSIGDGTVVAAAALVTKDCEPGALYGGVPARRLR